MRCGGSFLLVLGTSVSLAMVPTRAAGAVDLTCASSATLEALVSCIRDHLPGRGSRRFVAPSFMEMSAWRSVAFAMLRGDCGFALPYSLSPLAQNRRFHDAETGRSYCVLMETADWDGDGIFDRGFGAFIVDASAERELSHQVAHPISDTGTETQAVTLFKETRSRTFLLAGAHRDASPGEGGLLGSSASWDAAHNTATMFHATHMEIMAYYGEKPWWAIQWHGMAEDTCERVDVHLSHGVDTPPAAGDKILELRAHLLAREPTWRISVAGSGLCSLDATSNVQGRLLNIAPAGGSFGALAAPPSTRRFVHIEQHAGFRDPDRWVDAVLATWP
ncbi:hypothetical protein WMF20_26015 [Sorangium sp. So ce834]|uniref:hypothetical protein n=1 Tax=Sorangium sp. So ce834 TaxID=3133321 RepID=UPI003F630898